MLLRLNWINNYVYTKNAVTNSGKRYYLTNNYIYSTVYATKLLIARRVSTLIGHLQVFSVAYHLL
jgi:hypothetical protein